MKFAICEEDYMGFLKVVNSLWWKSKYFATVIERLLIKWTVVVEQERLVRQNVQLNHMSYKVMKNAACSNVSESVFRVSITEYSK